MRHSVKFRSVINIKTILLFAAITQGACVGMSEEPDMVIKKVSAESKAQTLEFTRTQEAIKRHRTGDNPLWQSTFVDEYNNFITTAGSVCAAGRNETVLWLLSSAKIDKNYCRETNDCFLNDYHYDQLKNAQGRAYGECGRLIRELTKNQEIINSYKGTLERHINAYRFEAQGLAMIKRRNDEQERMRQREDIERKEQQKQQQAQRAKEQCLGNGQIGICQSSSQNNIQFLCGQNTVTALENIFNQYCYVTDKFNIKTTMEVRNNTGRAVKDISFACEQNAKSGTVLRRGEKTVYDVWGPGESKIITLEFIKHEQVQSMTCRARSWQ
jgi:hypothetical protein